MNLQTLRDELFARGTDYLSEDAQGVARAERWLNEGYREIINLQAWPFLWTTMTGTSPVNVRELRRIMWVVRTDTRAPLSYVTMEELVNHDQVDVWQPGGTPTAYWIEAGAQLWAYPYNTDIELDVTGLTRVDFLSGTMEPVFDEEYHGIIVDKAMVRAYIDSDNFEAANALKVEINEKLAAMAEDYQIQKMAPSYIRVNPVDG